MPFITGDGAVKVIDMGKFDPPRAMMFALGCWIRQPENKENVMAVGGGFLSSDSRRWEHLIIPPVPQVERFKSGEWNTTKVGAGIVVRSVSNTHITLGMGSGPSVTTQTFYEKDLQELIQFLQGVEDQMGK